MLPYWNSDLALEIAPWFPLGVDYQPISINRLYSPQLRQIAARCLELDSEFFFMSSPRAGCIGSLVRDNFYRDEPFSFLTLGFLMILGYSPRMEHLVDSLLKGPEREKLSAGVAFCSLWNDSIPLGSMKVIAVVSQEPFFDEADFLDGFEKRLFEAKGKDEVPFFAEKFGYRRFCVPYETDDPLQLSIRQLLYEMEFAETRQMVGPSPESRFPQFLG